MITHFLNKGTKYHVGNDNYSASVDKEFIEAYPVIGQAWAQAFSVSQDDSVVIEIKQLWGVDHGTNNHVYIDTTDIGMITGNDNRKSWISESSWDLKAGRQYILKIASLGPGDPDDFVFEGVVVRSVKGTKVVQEGPPKILLLPEDDYWKSNHDKGNKSKKESSICGENLIENLSWNYGVKKGDATSFLLAAPADTGVLSKPITEINPGEFTAARFRITQVKPGNKFGRAFEFLYGSGNGKRNGWVFSFAKGKDEIVSGYLKIKGEYNEKLNFDTSIYKSNQWNKMQLHYCTNKQMRLEINGKMLKTHFIDVSGPKQIFARAYAVDVAIDG
jgi:hypothetical protein